MAIKYLDGDRITGLSTDAKPDRDTSDATIPALTVEAGSVFIETDTGSKYVHNGTAWIQQPFDSITSALGRNDGVIQRQWFQEWFTGKSLNTDIWGMWNESGSGSFAMSDSVDGGFSITTSAGGRSGIDFSGSAALNPDGNAPRLTQFSHNSSTIIAVVKKTALSSRRLFVGFRYDGTTNGTAECALLHSHDGGNIGLLTGDDSGGDTTAGSVAPSTNYILTKIVLKTSSCDMNINGILDVTRTEDLPTVATQPQLMARDDGSGTCIVHCTYMEAYNT